MIYAWLFARLVDEEAIERFQFYLMEPFPDEEPNAVAPEVVAAEMDAFRAVQAML